MLSYAQIKKAIIASLSDDLLHKNYLAQRDPSCVSVTGHCAVASEAFYYLAGGREAGFIPAVCSYEVDKNGIMRRESHWWIQGPKAGQRGRGEIFDITAAQFPFYFPYEKGRHVGFMQPQGKPSKRAQVVIDRVMTRLGRKALAEFRQNNISRFCAASNAIKARKNSPQRQPF